MNEQIIDINDITYSREIYEAKPRPFVSAFIYLFLIIMITAFAWTYFSEMDILARGNGIVRPNENVSTLRVEYAGKLEQMNAVEGESVSKNDVLFVIDHDGLLLQKVDYEEKIKDIEERLIGLRSYEKSIVDGEGDFAQPSAYNDYYQTQYENYNVNMAYLTYQKESTKLQLAQNKQTNVISSQLKSLRDELSQAKKLKASIVQEESLVAETMDKEKYDNYVYTTDQYEAELELMALNLEKSKVLQEEGIIAYSELESEEQALFDYQLTYNQYKSSYMASLDEEIGQLQDSISQYEAQWVVAKATDELLDNEEANGDTVLQKYRSDTIVGVQEEIKGYEETLQGYEVNLDNINLQIEQAVIKSPIDGSVNLLTEASKGDYLSVGTELMTIIPENEAGYSVDIALPNSEVAGVEAGDLVKFQFQALPFKEYGEFTGTIEKISSDIKSDSTGSSYYLIEARLNDTEGISYKGEVQAIKIGMACEAYVIKEQKKVLYWLLEKINLRD